MSAWACGWARARAAADMRARAVSSASSADTAALADAAAKARAVGIPDAATRLADLVQRLGAPA